MLLYENLVNFSAGVNSMLPLNVRNAISLSHFKYFVSWNSAHYIHCWQQWLETEGGVAYVFWNLLCHKCALNVVRNHFHPYLV